MSLQITWVTLNWLHELVHTAWAGARSPIGFPDATRNGGRPPTPAFSKTQRSFTSKGGLTLWSMTRPPRNTNGWHHGAEGLAHAPKKKKRAHVSVTHTMSRSRGLAALLGATHARLTPAWVALYNKQLVLHEREKNENRKEREICQTIRAVKRREHDRCGVELLPENCAHARASVLKLRM